MKKTITVIGTVLLSSLLMVGCSDANTSNGASDGGSSSSSSTQKLNKSDAIQFINDYYNGLITSAQESLDNSTQVETTIQEVVGEDVYNEIVTTEDPFDSLSSLSADQQKELADKVQALNPVAEYYNFSGMSDNDRTYLNLLSIASNSLLASSDSPATEDSTITAKIDENKVNVKANKAVVNFSDIAFSINGTETDQSADSTGLEKIYLVYSDNAWKIDGKTTFENIKTQYNDTSTASDGGE